MEFNPFIAEIFSKETAEFFKRSIEMRDMTVPTVEVSRDEWYCEGSGDDAHCVKVSASYCFTRHQHFAVVIWHSRGFQYQYRVSYCIDELYADASCNVLKLVEPSEMHPNGKKIVCMAFMQDLCTFCLKATPDWIPFICTVSSASR